MRPFEVYLHAGLLESVPKSGTQRQRIMDFIYSLRERPETRGDFTDKDASLRERQIKIVGDYAVTYWSIRRSAESWLLKLVQQIGEKRNILLLLG